MILLQQQLVPQQIHHLSGSASPNVVAVPSGQPIGKLVHYTQVPTNVSQMPRRHTLLLEVSVPSQYGSVAASSFVILADIYVYSICHSFSIDIQVVSTRVNCVCDFCRSNRYCWKIWLNKRNENK